MPVDKHKHKYVQIHGERQLNERPTWLLTRCRTDIFICVSSIWYNFNTSTSVHSDEAVSHLVRNYSTAALMDQLFVLAHLGLPREGGWRHLTNKEKSPQIDNFLQNFECLVERHKFGVKIGSGLMDWQTIIIDQNFLWFIDLLRLLTLFNSESFFLGIALVQATHEIRFICRSK